MFEKEAEEYANVKEIERNNLECVIVINHEVFRAFKDGAEFGYNKAFVEADKNLKAVVADFNKANEWHKVADEGLPINKNDGATYLLYTIYGEGGSPVVAHFAYRDKQELMNVWTGAILTEDKIVAWKEIVLPEGE